MLLGGVRYVGELEESICLAVVKHIHGETRDCDRMIRPMKLVCNESVQTVQKKPRVQSPSVFNVAAIKIQNQDESEVFGFYLNID